MTSAEPYAALRSSVAAANRAVAESGLVVLSFGNVSGVDRDRGVFAIKPSGVPCAELTPGDVVVVSLADGSNVWGEGRPSSDTPTHRVLYNELPQTGGIVHTHSVYATSWAQAHRAVPCLGTTHADHFRGPVPVTRPLTDAEITGDYEENTGRVIIELFAGPEALHPAEAPGVLVASHGPFVWGDDAAAAARNAVAVELMAQMALHTFALAPDRAPVSEALLARHYSRKHGPLAYYGQP